MTRVIRYFNKTDESYIGEVVLPEIPLVLLQKVYGVSTDNPMYDSYPVCLEQEIFFKKYVKTCFRFDTFDYFLDYDA